MSRKQLFAAVISIINAASSLYFSFIGFRAIWHGNYEKAAAYIGGAIWLLLVAQDGARYAGIDRASSP